MRRRECITLLGGWAVAWLFAAMSAAGDVSGQQIPVGFLVFTILPRTV